MDQSKYFWYENFKKPFVIYNRNESNNLAVEPTISDCTEKRNCFLYDKATRSLFRHSSDDNNILLVGNTYFGSIGKHNETHNDYNNNKVDGGGSYGTVLGLNNILNYNNNGGFVAGRYNLPDNNYLFAIGNGKDDNNRSNLIQCTDNTTYINGELEVNGIKFSDVSSNVETNNTQLNKRLDTIESKLNQLITELQSLTILVDGKNS